MRDISKLGRREAEVAALFAIGHSCTEIARKLSRSVKTISTHKTRIRDKLQITTSIEWMAFLKEFQT